MQTVAQAAGVDPGRFGPYMSVDPRMLPHRELMANISRYEGAAVVGGWLLGGPLGAGGADYALRRGATYVHAPRYLPPLNGVLGGWTPPMGWNGSAWTFANPRYSP